MKKLLIESKILEKFEYTDEYEDHIKKSIELVKSILEYKEYINVFKLEHEQDIEMTILRAFLNCIKKF